MSKDFPLGVLLSMTTGKMLCNFSDMHEAAELILGHPVWTHEFADRNLCDKIKARVLAQHPDLADLTADGVNGKNWLDWLGKAIKKYGRERTLIGGKD